MAKEGTKEFAWWAEAETMFGDYFGQGIKDEELPEVIEAFCQTDAKEQRFYLAKLLFLNLRAQRTIASLNVQILREMREINADDGDDDGDDDAPQEQPKGGGPPRRRRPDPRGSPAPAGGKGGGGGAAPSPARTKAPEGQEPIGKPGDNGVGGELVDDDDQRGQEPSA